MLDTLAKGGWVMVPLALCSLVGLAVVIERAFALRRHRVLDPRILRLVVEYDGSSAADAAIHVCRRSRGPFARVIEEILKVRHLTDAQVLEVMNVTGRTQVGQMERGLTVLEIVASISPLLGLLGTVLGMVSIFNAITEAGIGNPQVLSSGISEALITTVTGLVIAIPALAFYSWFSRRIDDFATEMQDRATGFITRLRSMEK